MKHILEKNKQYMRLYRGMDWGSERQNTGNHLRIEKKKELKK